MLTFDTLTYQNFLSTGNAPITVKFEAHPTTLVVGQNGAGKSTMNDALCFALFGKPLRNVNKPKLVNSINARECLVELTFRTSSNDYRIRRGIKPTVFEIYENGTLIPAPASALDYQEILETRILKLNFKSFQQVVVLGNASYVPFMRLTAAARREIIEDLLDIEVFSSMNALAKEDLGQIKSEMDKCAQARDLLSQQVAMAQQFSSQLAEQHREAVQRIDEAMDAETAAMTGLREDRRGVERRMASLPDTDEALRTVTGKLRKYEQAQTNIAGAQRKLQRERIFYEQHDHCPTCEQSITHEFKEARYETIAAKTTDAQKAADQCQRLITRYENEVAAARRASDERAGLQRELDAIDVKLSVRSARLKDLTREKAKVEKQAAAKAPAVDIAALDQQLADITAQHSDLSQRRVITDAASMLLKDSGIKARVVGHYLPIINRTINHYLTAMDFPILFTLNEEFEEQIKSRYRDDFAYESFSEGEKKRIDLALLLTWRAIARMKNSAATNVLILDEVFDSSLDAAGTDEFLKIIRTLEKDTHVYVISHKTDQLIDKFSHVMRFEKQRGFSLVAGKA